MEVTNEKLIVKAKEGCMESYELLFKRNKAFTHFIANKFPNVGEMEDVEAVARFGMLKAYKAFDVSKGFKFATYASRVMENEILMYARRLKKHQGVLSIELPAYEEDDGREILLSDVLAGKDNLEEDYCSKESIQILKVLIGELNTRDKRIIQSLYFDRKTQKEVAKEMGFSQSYISKLERHILERLRKKYTA